MTTGNTLLELKTKSQSAEMAYDYKQSMWFERVLGIFILASVLPTIILVVTFSSVGKAPSDAFIFAIIGVAILISALFRSKDSKKIKILKEVKTKTRNEYWAALKSEMREHGIDTAKMKARGDIHDDSHEFTAPRNGVISDITIRSFGNELILMMNGERMTKNSVIEV